MPIPWSQYQIAASGDIEAMLESSNNVQVVTGIVSGDDSQIIYATAAGICCISRDSTTGINTKVGYFAETDITSLATDGTYLYVGWGTGFSVGNIGRITIASLFNNGDTDRVADYDDDWGTAAGSPLLSSTYGVWSLDCKEISGTYYLAVGTFKTYIYNISTGASYYSVNNSDVEHIALTDAGDLFAANKNTIYFKNNAHSLAANSWTWDNGTMGNADDDFEDDVVHESWSDYGSTTNGTTTLSESGGKLRVQIEPSSTTSYWNTNRYIGLQGDFDIILTGIGGDNGSAITGGEIVQRELRLYSINDSSNDSLKLYQKYYYSSSEKMLTYSEIKVGGSIVVGDSDIDSSPPAVSDQADAKIRIERVGNTITTYYWNHGDGSWTTSATWTDAALAAPMYMFLQFYAYDKNGETLQWDIYDFVNDDAQDVYSKFTKLKDFSGIDASIPASTLNLVAAQNGAGFNAIEIDQSDIEDSTFYQWRESGGDYNTLTSENCQCIRMDGTGLVAWVGSDSGIDRCSLAAGTVDNFDENRGKLIDDDVVCLFPGFSAAYGGISGGGFIIGDTTPPDDITVNVKGAASESFILGWDRSTDADWEYSKIYRSKDGAAEDTLLENRTWGAPGTAMEIKEPCAFFDEDIDDGKYEYRVTQTDQTGNESDGNSPAAVYHDEPIVAIAWASIAGSSTTKREVAITVGGNSGDDTGNAAHVYAVDISESAAFTTYQRYLLGDGSSWTIGYRLSAVDGLKTVYARGVADSLLTGASDSLSVTLAENTPVANADAIEKPFFAWEFASDSRTWSIGNEDTDFPANNVRDQRLGRICRPTSWVDASADFAAVGGRNARSIALTCDLLASRTIDMFWMGAHNLASIAENSEQIKVYLCADETQKTSAYGWINGDYAVELTDHIDRHSFCTRPGEDYRYWAVVVVAWVSSPWAITGQLPEIGRVLLIRDSDVFEPEIGFDRESGRIRITDPSIVEETEDQAFEGVEMARRLEFSGQFSKIPNATWRTMYDMFKTIGKTAPLFVLLSPSDFKTGDTEPTTSDFWEFDPLYCQLAKVPELQSKGHQYTSFDLDLVEIIGGIDPYGLDD